MGLRPDYSSLLYICGQSSNMQFWNIDVPVACSNEFRHCPLFVHCLTRSTFLSPSMSYPKWEIQELSGSESHQKCCRVFVLTSIFKHELVLPFWKIASRVKRKRAAVSKTHYIPRPANHLRYLWRWINHYIIVKVHKVPGSWSNTLHFIAVCRALMLWLIAEWKWLERRKGLRLSNWVNTPCRWSNVCSKSQIVSAKLKRKNRWEKKERKFICSEDLLPASSLKLTGLQICSRTRKQRL